MKIFEDDDPLVINGTYDTLGYKPGESERIRKSKERQDRMAKRQQVQAAEVSDADVREAGEPKEVIAGAMRADRRRARPRKTNGGLTPEQAETIHALHTEQTPPTARGDIHYAEMIDLARLRASATNPRGRFDEGRLAELAASIRAHGVLEPLIVRPIAGNLFEIVAGERRFRAAHDAGIGEVPVIIRHLTDEQVLEFSLIENLHRDDLAPLELARGFRRLITTNPTKHSADSIASRIGMSPAWVWDRLKLLDLVPEAQQLLEEERIAIGHAILIARLKPADQARVIAHDDDRSTAHRGVGLWRPDLGFNFEAHERQNGKNGKASKYDGLKPCSIRELEAWINDHVRFDVAHAAQAQPLTFEPLAEQVKVAQAQPGRGKKVIAITFEHFTPPDARDDSERTYGTQSFRFADGQEHTQVYPRKKYIAQRCAHAVLGVVVAGDRRGEAFEVCIARDKCAVHWKKEIAEREKAAKQRTSGKPSATAKREAAAARREEKAAEEDKRREQRWIAFSKALKAAVLTAAEKMPAKLPRALYERTLVHHGIAKDTIPADLPKALMLRSIKATFDRYMFDADEPNYVGWAKALGVNVKACEPKAAATGK